MVLWYCGCSHREIDKNLFQSMGGCMILKMALLTDKKGEKKTCKYLYKLYLEIITNVLLGHKANGPGIRNTNI